MARPKPNTVEAALSLYSDLVAKGKLLGVEDATTKSILAEDLVGKEDLDGILGSCAVLRNAIRLRKESILLEKKTKERAPVQVSATKPTKRSQTQMPEDIKASREKTAEIVNEEKKMNTDGLGDGASTCEQETETEPSVLEDMAAGPLEHAEWKIIHPESSCDDYGSVRMAQSPISEPISTQPETPPPSFEFCIPDSPTSKTPEEAPINSDPARGLDSPSLASQDSNNRGHAPEDEDENEDADIGTMDEDAGTETLTVSIVDRWIYKFKLAQERAQDVQRLSKLAEDSLEELKTQLNNEKASDEDLTTSYDLFKRINHELMEIMRDEDWIHAREALAFKWQSRVDEINTIILCHSGKAMANTARGRRVLDLADEALAALNEHREAHENDRGKMVLDRCENWSLLNYFKLRRALAE